MYIFIDCHSSFLSCFHVLVLYNVLLLLPATTPVHIKNVDGNYMNEKVNKTEAILESDDNFLYSNHGKLLCSNLETPVLEVIHDYLDMKTDTISEFSVTDTTDSQSIAQMESNRDKRGFRKSNNPTEFMANAAKRLNDEFDVDNRIYCKEQLADAEDETSLQHGDDDHDNFLPSSLQHQEVHNLSPYFSWNLFAMWPIFDSIKNYIFSCIFLFSQ